MTAAMITERGYEPVISKREMAYDPDWHGYECSVQTGPSRGAARAAFASTDHENDITAIGCWRRYARIFSRQEHWEAYGRGSDHDPVLVPDSYEAREGVPAWEFVTRDTPGAIPIWVCGPQKDGPPPKPVSGRGKETRP